jgi:hypothetical protein
MPNSSAEAQNCVAEWARPYHHKEKPTMENSRVEF